MANDKQRRRRLKEKRHDYDLVEIDGDGFETVVTASETRSPRGSAGRKDAKGGAKGAAKPAGGRRGRVPEPANWRRVFKRTAIFAPIFLATIMLLGRGDMSLSAAVLQTAMLMVVFAPLSYLMDGLAYRMYNRRLQKER
ncbi:MAG: hypothetical protein EXQ77_01190 [Thermoleophilia bacterium]|nr:hypothetical protein [Thermoleophilia bacterium]